MPALQDKQLVDRVIDGDHSAHDEFVERYSRLVWALVSRLLPDGTPEHWDDAYQETFLRILYKLPTWSGGDLTSWVGRVATNRLIDIRRRSRSQREVPLDGFDGVADGQTRDPAVKLERLDREDRLTKCVKEKLAELPEPKRRLVEMLLDGRQPGEVQNLLGIPRSTFYYWLRQVRARLKECVDEY